MDIDSKWKGILLQSLKKVFNRNAGDKIAAIKLTAKFRKKKSRKILEKNSPF